MTNAKPKLLIVEDDLGLQKQLKWSYEDFEVFCASNRSEAIALVRLEEPDVVTLDLGLPPDPDGVTEGFAALEEMLRIKPDLKIIVASGHSAHESALNAIAAGAWDFYKKPVDIDELHLIVKRAFHVHDLEVQNQKSQLPDSDGETLFGTLVTGAPEMMKAARTVERVANTNASVLLLGASGTGKELLARGLHDASDRKSKPFVAINCGAIPENLLESELFGHEKGAFTGAIKTTEGKIEIASGGTLFLDEVGDIPMPLQVKLLRFLQERTIERIGGRKPIPVDVRIVCATHRNLNQMISDQTFREDLYYRLAEITVHIPSLTERNGDAVLLAKHFLARFAREMNPAIKGFAASALSAIDQWSWPGNVRELENRVKRAVIMADGKFITVDDMLFDEGDEDDRLLNLKAAREQADRKAINRAISRTEGNISNAAKLLGISRPTLYDLLKQYDMHA
ncbi:PEP-CTERM-box response regulator transcription factor [Sphingorhabdus sp.]|jgi:two-component system NtrC family response regulator|uniref:PEP-CTERM-box response regulator transcription factor n=1 Tax=Sphingorhabdus sp. TaxID=1902408 RepID=UPI003BB03D0A|nr:PEP-CTERM-box response regulator transcription factor [Sphingomonadales bacterium]MBK9431915.1 PEP-CTERM-box response regulator transcription factor [Sphingomonadales bacterium]MBL0022366.1 PEP-CTERM-box response regulator transcription factor [Sphingomonadales bacterium]